VSVRKIKLRGLARLTRDMRAIGVRRFAIEVDFDEPEEKKRSIGFASDVSEGVVGLVPADDDEDDDE